MLLPKDYVFPKLTLATLITAWHCGNQDEGIPPYKHLSVKDVYHIKAGKHKIAMMRLLMDAVRRATIIKNQEDLLKKDMTIEDCSNLHNSVKHMFKIPGKNEKTRRHQTLSWKTIYNRLAAKNWQLRGEQPAHRSQAPPNVRPHQREKTPTKEKPASKRKSQPKKNPRTPPARRNQTHYPTRASGMKQKSPSATQSKLPARKKPNRNAQEATADANRERETFVGPG